MLLGIGEASIRKKEAPFAAEQVFGVWNSIYFNYHESMKARVNRLDNGGGGWAWAEQGTQGPGTGCWLSRGFLSSRAPGPWLSLRAEGLTWPFYLLQLRLLADSTRFRD